MLFLRDNAIPTFSSNVVLKRFYKIALKYVSFFSRVITWTNVNATHL